MSPDYGLTIISRQIRRVPLVTVTDLDSEETSIVANNGDPREHVHDIEYLGSYIADSRKDLNTRKGMAWTACIKLLKVCTSGISENR